MVSSTVQGNGQEVLQDDESESMDVIEEEFADPTIGSKTKDRTLWSDAQVTLLLSLYGDNQELLDSNAMTYRQFYKILSQGLLEKGYKFSSIQCQYKIDNLKKKYKEVKDHNAKSGNNRKDFAFFMKMDDLFSKKPWVTPISVAGSDLPLMISEKENSMGKCSSNFKNQKASIDALKKEYLQSAIDERILRRKENSAYRQKKLQVLETLATALTQKCDSCDRV
ncbi:uncharacterized protein LOC111643892 [Copidosoma floridanum]|uniref:uncharacterized protein LOC111643717 n=1 Tax=Copidosoma floridanum TaxID=29053 RepID=UPI000C6FC513|nr:uncharacterized protein LOC111643717 [Copidosoma floridanum]XP_023247974.1 uncharacterized protein LOC111643892 [Copidosoma floridanum]